MILHLLLSPLWISTFVAVLMCFAFSLGFTLILDPRSGDCTLSLDSDINLFCTVILVPCAVWAFTCNGIIPRLQARIDDCWNQIFSPSRESGSFLQNFHEALLTSKVTGQSMIQSVFLRFFDRWVVVAIANLAFIPVIALSSSQQYATETQQSVASFFEIWAICTLFNDVISLFRTRHVMLSKVWKMNKAPQSIAVYFALISVVVLLVMIGLGMESTGAGQSFLLFTRLERVVLHVYLIFSLASLLKALNIYNDELVKAVVKSYNMTPAERASSVDSIDAPFRAQIAPPPPGSLPCQSNPLSESSAPPDLMPPVPQTCTLQYKEDIQNDYSQVYLESQKIMDLLKMVATVVFISLINDCTNIIATYGRQYDGGDILSIATKIMVFLLPWIYIFSYTYSRAAIAVSVARRACICVAMVIMWGATILLGCYLGCDFIAGADDAIKDSRANTFLIYLVKSSALPTTVSFGFVFLTSPTIRSWFSLPVPLQYIILPIIWLPPLLIQQIHEASGANFVVLGFLHTVGWISIVSLGLFSLTQTGVLVATITGIVMLLFAIKLLWPPGMPIPFVKSISAGWYQRLDEFLRDSKYGSYHVYLASCVFILYIIHALFMIVFAYSWYFIFACFAMGMLVLAHPAKRHFVSSTVHAKYTILSKVVTPIRDKSLSSIKLTLHPPEAIRSEIFEGGGDIIMLRNWNMDKSRPWLSYFCRHWETVHYFSVVGTKIVQSNNGEGQRARLIEVDLMIQKTRRKEGAASALMDSTAEELNNVDIVGYAKSNSLEALYSPCIIAFGFESGAAAFCSLMKKRMTMRTEIEHSKVVKASELTDICVVWTSFMRKGRGAVTAEAIAAALKELTVLQQYLYEHSGGRGVKMLFIATGVPMEYTPSPECIAHKVGGLEDKVAEACGFPAQIAKLSERWTSVDKLSIEEGAGISRSSSNIQNLRVSFANMFSDGWRSSGGDSGENSERPGSIDMSSVQSFSAPSNAPTTPVNRLPSIAEDNEDNSGSHRHVPMPPPDYSRLSRTSFADYRRSSLAGVRHQFSNELDPAKPKVTPIEMLLQVQAKEESWVPMRHALGSSWRDFQRVLDSRIGATLNWLNSAAGPDYTTVFVTEHNSDLALLRDFKYDTIYDEVNRSIIDHQLAFSKNPSEYQAGEMHEDGDPLHPFSTACAVLYSGDYATTKKARLHATVGKVRRQQEKMRQPALLTFVPDA